MRADILSWVSKSLRLRLFLTASLVMVMFAVLAIFVLDAAFKKTAESSVNEQLSAQLYTLLSIAELDKDNLLDIPEAPAEPRFSVPDSGLYAYLFDASGSVIWQSDSALDQEPIYFDTSPVGQHQFSRWQRINKKSGFRLDFTLAWEDDSGIQETYIFTLVETPIRFYKSVREFRSVLIWWGGLASVLLLILQIVILRWALTPLQSVATEIKSIEEGRQEKITGNYPDEIAALTRNLNELIINSQKTLSRYRNSLANLAHSLKTPLAMMRGMDIHNERRESIERLVHEQSKVMTDIVDYQLKRASSAAMSRGFTELLCGPLVQRLVRTLAKVYFEKNISFQIHLDKDLSISMESSDFLEVCGNIMENAAKWCDRVVKVHCIDSTRGVVLVFEDDGPGIPADCEDEVFSRGVRFDEKNPGQGIGLSVVLDIVESYSGSVNASTSHLGGAKITLQIPEKAGLSRS